MDYRKFGDKIFVRLDPNEEIVESLRRVCKTEDITLATVEGLGAISEFTAGVFDVVKRAFRPRDYKGSYEITSLTGTVTTFKDEVYLHLHMSAAKEDGVAMGGHLSRAVISATGEIVLTVLDAKLDRRYNEEIGLNLFRFDEKV